VRLAEGVRAGERHEVVGAQALGAETADELLDLHGRGGEARGDVVQVGGDPVAAAAGHGEREAAGDHGGVARRVGEDVGAGDHAGTDGLHGRLDRVHGVVAAQRDGQLLRLRVAVRLVK